MLKEREIAVEMQNEGGFWLPKGRFGAALPHPRDKAERSAQKAGDNAHTQLDIM